MVPPGLVVECSRQPASALGLSPFKSYPIPRKLRLNTTIDQVRSLSYRVILERVFGTFAVAHTVLCQHSYIFISICYPFCFISFLYYLFSNVGLKKDHTA